MQLIRRICRRGFPSAKEVCRSLCLVQPAFAARFFSLLSLRRVPAFPVLWLSVFSYYILGPSAVCDIDCGCWVTGRTTGTPSVIGCANGIDTLISGIVGATPTIGSISAPAFCVAPVFRKGSGAFHVAYAPSNPLSVDLISCIVFLTPSGRIVAGGHDAYPSIRRTRLQIISNNVRFC